MWWSDGVGFYCFLRRGGAHALAGRGGKGRHGLGALWVGLQAARRVPIGAGGGEPHLAPSYWSEVGARPGRGPAADCGREGGARGGRCGAESPGGLSCSELRVTAMSGCRVFIGRLNPAAREKDVERFFKGYGRIRDIDLKRGFGFVVSAPPRSASRSLTVGGHSSSCAFDVHGVVDKDNAIRVLG